jgi:outer membrane receptor protein involved in Fe transport
MSLKSVLLTSAGCCLLASTVPAAAQDLQDEQSAEVGTETVGDVGDIIVTARKRQESILRVPVIQSVLTAEQLDRHQVSDLVDIAGLTPGVVLGLGTLEVGTQISIRGIGTSSANPGIDQSVSLNLDGLQVSQGSAYSVGVFDMAQVEILKGPQALFFGKNSPGGVVAIRTADPGRNLELMTRLGYEFVANEMRGEAIVSGPVSDTLGLRLAARYSDFGGYFRNTATPIAGTGAVAPDPRFGKSTTLYLRGTAVFEPTDNLHARLKLNYTRDRQSGGVPYQLVSCPDGLTNYAGRQYYSDNEDCRADRRNNIVDMDPAAYSNLLPNNGRAFTNITQKFGTLELNYDLRPALTLTSVTGYFDLTTDALMNGTESGAAAPPLAAAKQLEREEFTQELRLTSDFASPLNFTAGAFYQDGSLSNSILASGNTLYGMPAILLKGSHDIDIESISAFGQLRFKPSPQFEIAGGVRWTREKRSDSAQTLVGGAIVDVAVPKLSSSNWSPELTVSYFPTDDLTIFGSLKQGYKSGSYNIPVPVNPGQDPSFGDEKVQGGEIGLKARLADRQLMVNLAGYYYEYDGLQVGANETVSGGLPIIRTINSGSARIYGVDFDFTYRPHEIDGLNVRGAVNWNHARFTQFSYAPCWGGQTIAEGCNQAFNPVTGRYQGQDLTGLPLPRAPDWQANLGVDYELPVGRDMRLALAADGQYSSRFLANLGRRPDFYQDAFAKINASVALKGETDQWEVALIGNNLTDKLTTGSCGSLNYAGGQVAPGIISGAATKGPAGSDELHCIFDRGREVWLRITFRP